MYKVNSVHSNVWFGSIILLIQAIAKKVSDPFPVVFPTVTDVAAVYKSVNMSFAIGVIDFEFDPAMPKLIFMKQGYLAVQPIFSSEPCVFCPWIRSVKCVGKLLSFPLLFAVAEYLVLECLLDLFC